MCFFGRYNANYSHIHAQTLIRHILFLCASLQYSSICTSSFLCSCLRCVLSYPLWTLNSAYIGCRHFLTAKCVCVCVWVLFHLLRLSYCTTKMNANRLFRSVVFLNLAFMPLFVYGVPLTLSECSLQGSLFLSFSSFTRSTR